MKENINMFINKLSTGIGNNKIIKAITSGLMSTISITLGVAAIAIITNFPIQSWFDLMQSTGIYDISNEFIGATSGLLALYMTFAISVSYASEQKMNGTIVGVISAASFIALMPQSLKSESGEIVSGLSLANLGSNGMFVGIIVAIVISSTYVFLMKKNITIKFPESVPSMVSDSLSPTFVAIIIFTFIFLVKLMFSLTPYGDIFVAINTFVTAPILSFSTSPWSMIGMFTLMNLLWFFGIHPAPILSVYEPILVSATIANIAAYLGGARGYDLPYIYVPMVYLAAYLGGAGNTIGLAISMLSAKSERFKALGKLSIVPNIFNINEPIIFGAPIMLNPIFFIPLVSSSLIGGTIAIIFTKLGIGSHINPTMQLPWVTPNIVTAYLSGGIGVFLMVLICIVVYTLLYYPFFRIADKRALMEEQNSN
ncbi:PTS sugar transporter subunit IIC [Clostridium sp. UBA1652]|uniref:PTS sugar transporter subunit IIC n=1 Tax=Clostridium sp. UBA1652 TaxID=1946348 RepID=UPI0025802B0A|nr:PTS transporter subunit EIIC [Clostridium sp. UBA1652]